MPTIDENRVDYQVTINAVEALKSLETLLADASSVPEVMQGVQTKIQQTADKMGVSFGVMESKFKEVIKNAEMLREALAISGETSFGVPLLDKMSGVSSPFGAIGNAAGFKGVNDLRREGLAIEKEEAKTAEQIAKELNQQAVEAAKIEAVRQKNLELANQELMAVEKEATALQSQMKNYGQISRTASETAQYLQRFAGTEQGQSILTKFFGNYQQVSGVVNQINVLKSSIRELATATGSSFSQAGKVFEQQFSNVPGITSQTSQAVRELNKEFEKVPEKAGKTVRSIDAIRIALGALVAMLVFNVIQAVQDAFKTMIDNVREAELAVYNLVNAEKRLSQEGIDVTPKGLQETIDSVSKLVPILSKIQVDELVSRIATNVAPALKLTNEQIRQMAEATALLYVRNKALGKSFDEVESQLTNAFLTGKVSQGINQLGVKISDQIVKDEALRLGLVKTAKEFDNLSGEVEAHVKSVAMLSVVYKNAKQDVGAIGDYMETSDAAIESSKAAWSDLLTFLGQIFGPGITLFFQTLTQGLLLLRRIWVAQISAMLALWVAFTYKIEHPFASIQEVAGQWQKAFDIIKENFKEMQSLAENPDTPTAILPPPDQSTLTDWTDFKNKIEDILQDIKNAKDDLDKKLSEKKADLDLEYQRKAIDAEKDYQRKVADINKDAERAIANLKEKQRQDDLKAEQDYQNKLWELRMRYLMDLEDALHARDARQVLRLMKQFAIDKEALERKKGLDDKQRASDQKAQLEDIELKRKQRLEDAQLEYQQKLADQRVAKQRELDDLNVWYAREQADIQTALQRKMETLIKGWIDEQKITQDNAAAVYGILAKYFGPGGMTDQLYKYMMGSLIASTQGAISAAMLMGGLGGRDMSGPIPIPSTGDKGGRSGGRAGRRMAEGGTLLATRPTTVTFGEAGAEMASFVPLNRIGRDVGKVVGGGGSNAGGLGGTIVVDLNLSPDLEARIVSNSMDGVAEVIAKVTRSK